MPTDSALSRVSAPSRIAFNSLPKRFTDPSLGRSKPIARFNSVVLPEPDGPQTATHSSVDTVKSTSTRASMLRPRTRYVFHACLMWIAFVTPHLLFAARTGSKRRVMAIAGAPRRPPAGSDHSNAPDRIDRKD